MLRYTEGFYADGGNKDSLWRSARASCGEAAAAVQLLSIDGRVTHTDAREVRALLTRTMQMLARLISRH